MITETSSVNALYVTQMASRNYDAAVKVPENSNQIEDDAVVVDVSENAQTANRLLRDLAPLDANPAPHLKAAETRLKELMQDLGIPETTKVNISVTKEGTFTVEGEHPLFSQIEEKLNDGSERELSNSLKGAHNGSIMMRIGTAIELAMQGADANSNMTDTYYSWVKNTVAAQAISMGYEATFNGGTLSGTLIDSKGVAVAYNEGLSLPAG